MGRLLGFDCSIDFFFDEGFYQIKDSKFSWMRSICSLWFSVEHVFSYNNYE